MAIYAEKRDGKLTGRFRVELKKGAERYRVRFDSMAEAQAAEKAVKEAWERGDSVVATPSAPKPHKAAAEAPEGWTLSKAALAAYGKLWHGKVIEATAWAHIRDATKIIGGDTLLDDIKPHHIEDLQLALLKKKKSPATVNRYISHLRTLLTWCFERDMRTVPLHKLAIAWCEEPQNRIRWITEEEEAKLIAFMPPHMKPIIRIAIETGLRRSELLNLSMENLTERDSIYLMKTKNRASRTVPVTSSTYEELVGLIKRQEMPTARNLRSWWNRAKKHMGLKDDITFVFHTCRHTCATRFLRAGLPVATIQKWMGHKNIQTTLRYAHVYDQMLKEALQMRGNYEKGLREAAQNTAVSTVPPCGETCGEYGLEMAKAA